jgi:DNA repair photolyase
MSRSDDPILGGVPRGRGTARNPAGRFERHRSVAEPDGWDSAPEADLPPLRTEVRDEVVRRILMRNSSPDVPFDRSVNPYRGCEHGCIYCFARPSHGYLGLSAGLDFETRLIARPGAAAALRRELSRPGYAVAPIAIGTNTDAYQPIEGPRRIMRGLLEVLAKFRHPVMIATKGTLIERDIDLLAGMAAEGLAQVGITVTTLDADLSRRMEPRVPAPARRLRTIARLAEAGVPVRVMVSPVIPALTDHEIEPILAAAADAGATAASWVLLRLPHEVAPLFRDWLQDAYPDRAARVMGRVRETQGGQDYDATFGKRMRGEGPHAALIARRFAVATARLGLSDGLPPLDCTRFAVPGQQLSLF